MANLLGRVPFGRVSNDPRMIVTQLVYLTSLFFILLGASVAGLELWSAFIGLGDPTTVPATRGTGPIVAGAGSYHGSSRNMREAFSSSEMNVRSTSSAVDTVHTETDLLEGGPTTTKPTNRKRSRRQRTVPEGNESSDNKSVKPSFAGERESGEAEGERAENSREELGNVGAVLVKENNNKAKGKVTEQDDKEEAPTISFEFGTFSPVKTPSRGGGTRDPSKRYLHGNFYISFDSLFIPTEIGESSTALSANTKFVLAHIITAVLLCYPAAICIERRKFVTDFILTVYLSYYVFTISVSHSLFQPFAFWVGTLAAFIISMVGTSQIAYRREMAEVLISAEDSQPMATIVSAAGTGNNANNNVGGMSPFN